MLKLYDDKLEKLRGPQIDIHITKIDLLETGREFRKIEWLIFRGGGGGAGNVYMWWFFFFCLVS